MATITGTDGNDNLIGTSSDDQITGLAGDDTLTGGQGNDLLYGGLGSNTYVFSKGDGADDWVYANNIERARTETIAFNDLASTESISITANNSNLVLTYGTSDKITVYKSFSNSDYRVNQFAFTDTILSWDQLLEKYTLKLGDTNGETVSLTNGANIVQGGGGNDSINGMGGDDTIYGGYGSDTIYGGDGNDIIYGDAVNAKPDGSADTLDGGAGSNVYYFSTGFGKDTVISTSGSDLVVFTDIATLSASAYSQNGYDLIITVTTSDKLTIQNYYSDSVNPVKAANTVKEFLFADTVTAPSGTDKSITIHQINTNYIFTAADFGFTDVKDPTPDQFLAVKISALPSTGSLELNGSAVTAGQFVQASDLAAGLLVFIPPANAHGKDYSSFTFQVQDNGGVLGTNVDLDQSANTINISGNYAPTVANAIPDQTNQVGKAFSYQIPANTFSDPENDVLTYTAKLTDGSTLPGWLHFDAATHTLSGTQDNNAAAIRITATDTAGNTVYDDFVINVNHSVNAKDTVTVIKDILAGQLGNYDEIFDGGAGADKMIGYGGNDTYLVDNPGDVVVDIANGGTDEIRSSVSYILPANVENLILTGSANINGTGNMLANLLTGNDGNNILDGGLGIDSYAGGKGNDTYIVDSIPEASNITEAADGGNDTIKFKVNSDGSYMLGSNIENAILLGTGLIALTGNDLNNQLTGNAKNNTLSGGIGNDLLDGGKGIDTMKGGSGNDTYVVDNKSDVVNEEGNTDSADWIWASIGIDLKSIDINNTPLYTGIENIELTGNAALKAYGNDGDNILLGNNGNNLLDGGKGADAMEGGKGNDTYIVDNAADTVKENANSGTDLVLSSVSFTLSTDVENLTLTGADNIDATGNALKNILIGNDGNNKLDGGDGIDILKGGLGNDTYIVDLIQTITGVKLQDSVVETAAIGSGNDTLELRGDLLLTKAATLTLAANLENIDIYKTYSTWLNVTGNAADNVIIGNDNANTLDGGLGNDTLTGGNGSDTFVFSKPLNASTNVDTITDFVSGTDKIQLNKAIFGGLSQINGHLDSANLYIVGSLTPQDSNDHIIFDSVTGNLYYDKDGNGSSARVEFATLTGVGSLVDTDFWIV